jgi:PHD/YefM family antitoxin component YafN of YafNO toxin-antitoxin module
MHAVENIKSISYLKSHAAKISEDLEMNGKPFFITQNGEASMVLEGVKQYQEKVELIALLKLIALGEKDRLAGTGVSIAESRALLAARRSGK